ncbi:MULTISPECIES: hypothetical protein [Microbacterium]|uniref:Uncharacterized protein n=1 Tax=Microbacterium oleivorans TaxID=273677 RepID=A0A177K7X1_9MICO|nr:hypothetical protein [Microbacterium oleivorans]OAH49499.1 hypothetical protein AYL44_11640 [Microbacterium oleivorans]
MTHNDGDSSPRRYRWKYGPLRLVMPWVCVVVGVGMAIKGLVAPENDGTTFVVLGVGFVILGVVAAIVARWMAKRGI